MTRHILVGRLADTDPVDVPEYGRPTHVELLDGRGRLAHGLAAPLRQLRAWGYRPSERALDLLLVAALVTAADTRISRRVAQDRWSREIELNVPVAEPDLWNGLNPLLVRTLTFLTGDRWSFAFRERRLGIGDLVRKPAARRAIRPTSVCLLSGGLDSFIGAVDLLARGERPAFVSHHWDASTSASQERCVRALSSRFAGIPLPRVHGHVGYRRDLVPGVRTEDTLRGRSFLFFALAVLAADAFGGPLPVYVPENGFISLNVPLDWTRLGALSTRTTHPFYMARFGELLRELGLEATLVNPYRLATKGEMVADCTDPDFLGRTAKETMSCSSPTKARWVGLEPTHCGTCVPCLIRRGALLRGLGRDDTRYVTSDLEAHVLDTTRAEGVHVRAFQVAIDRLRERPHTVRIDIHRPGPLTDHPTDHEAYARVYAEGLLEVDALLSGVRARPQ